MGVISKDSIVIKQNKNFNKIDKNQLLGDSVRKNKNEVLDQQRIQLLTGAGNDGKKIKPKYSNKKYSDKKSKLNPLAGRGNPDLKLSGDTHDNLDLTVGVPNDSAYTVYSDVPYFKYLDKKYTTAFDLSNKNALKVVKVSNDYFKNLHKQINQ